MRYEEYIQGVQGGKILTGQYIKLAVDRFLAFRKRKDMEFREDKVKRVVDLFAILKHYTGRHNGKPFILEPWQQFIIAHIYGFYWKDTDTRVTTSAYIEISRKNGKAIDVNTPIPTPEGFVKMLDLKVGDTVFDRDGCPTKITYKSKIFSDKRCFRITFEDKSFIDACGDHLWVVRDRRRSNYGKYPVGINGEEILDTETIISRGIFKNRRDGKGIEYYFRIPMQKAIQLPECSLPIDPYTLGVWLGDGNARDARITNPTCDSDILRNIPYNVFSNKPDNRRDHVRSVLFKGLQVRLRSLNLINNKHIPEIYLRSSIDQRLSLLQGIMDADGYASESGQCEITQKSDKISGGICLLLSSLGIKYSKKTKIPTINRNPCNPVSLISFYTDKSLPCFRLQRKFDRLKDKLNDRMLYKSIISINEIKSVPVQCIEVDSPTHTYQSGINHSVTHNTAFSAGLGLYHLIADGENGAEVDLAANSKDQAKVAFTMASVFSKGIDPNNKFLDTFRDSILFDATHSKLNVFASDDSKLDGFNASMYLLDEFHAAKNNKLKSVLQSSMGMRDNPLGVIITTAGFDMLGVCYDHRRTCVEILTGIKEDDSIAAFIFSLDEGDDWKDSSIWIKSNPNLDVTVKKSYIQGEIKKAINSSIEEVGVKTKTLNIWCDSEEVWIPEHYIINGTKPVSLEDFTSDDDVFVGIDLSATSDLTCVTYMIPKDNKFYFKTKYYLPKDALKTKKHKELYGEWARTGDLVVTPGNVVDYDYILNDLMDNDKKLFIQKIGYDAWNATQFVINAEDKGLPMEPYSQTIGNFNRPTKELERIILSGDAVIDNNVITRHCFRNVIMARDRNGNVKPSKQFEDKKIDGVIGMIQALGVYLTSPHYENKI